MSDVQTAGRFGCGGCGKRYPWKPEWAGRKLKCKCGAVVACPATDPAPAAVAPAPSGRDDDGMYDLAPDPRPPQAPLAEPVALAAPAPVLPAAGRSAAGARVQAGVDQPVVSIPPVASSTLGYHSAPRGDDGAAIDAYFPDKVKDLYTPLWLIGGGTVVELVAAVFRYRGSPAGMAIGFTEVGAKLILGTAFMLAGILIAARLRGLELGRFWTAVLKLVAISIAPGALVTLFRPALMLLPVIGTLLGWAIDFCLYFALIGMLFDLDESDTWFCVIVIFVLKVMVAIGIVWFVLTTMRV